MKLVVNTSSLLELNNNLACQIDFDTSV